MSKPRPIHAGEVVAITRRTMARKFLLRPDSWVADAFGYLLAHHAAKHDVGVIGGVLMSDHYHLMVVDRAGVLPTFVNELNASMARVVNAMRKRRGPVWDERRPHYQTILDPQACLAMTAYQLANPVAAGLVAHGREWPGFRTTPNEVGEQRAYARPDVLASEDETYPESATLALVAPSWGVVTAADRFGRELAEQVRQHEARARGAMSAGGRTFAGVRAVKATPWWHEATTPEERGEPRPIVAATCPTRRAEYLTARRGFVALHALAKAALAEAGRLREVVFPFGTWLMRRVFGVTVERAPA